MANKVYGNVEKGIVEGSGHWLAENPKSLVKNVLDFVEKS